MEIRAPHNTPVPFRPAIEGGAKKNFGEVLELLAREMATPKNVEALLRPATNTMRSENRDLLQAQIQMQSYALKVEMISKAGEGLSTTVRKLQQG